MMMERNIINNDNASLLDLDSSSSDDTCTPANAPRVYENILEGARGRSALAQDSTVIRHYESFASEQGRPSYDNLKKHIRQRANGCVWRICNISCYVL